VVLAAGRYLAPPNKLQERLPQGLGTRHEAAASITAVTKAVALCISQSTGTVSIFKDGSLITDIQKPWGRNAESL
jgi:diadenylate cyclase